MRGKLGTSLKRPRKRSERIVREGPWSDIPKPIWYRSKRMLCAVCGRRYGDLRTGDHVDSTTFMRVKQVIDHIFPRRFVEKYGLAPHSEINLLSCCQSCHGRKLKIETLIFAGDVYGFIQGLNKIGYPMERVIDAATFYGFYEVGKFPTG